MRTGKQPDSDGSANGLCDFPLVDGAKTCFSAGFDAAHVCDVFAKEVEVL